MFINYSDALKEGPLIIVSQMSEGDQMQEFMSKVPFFCCFQYQAVVLFDWEKAIYNAVVLISFVFLLQIYSNGSDNPAVLENDLCIINRYVIEKKRRVPGEPFDINEDVDNFDIQILDYADSDMDEEEYSEENESEYSV